MASAVLLNTDTDWSNKICTIRKDKLLILKIHIYAFRFIKSNHNGIFSLKIFYSNSMIDVNIFITNYYFLIIVSYDYCHFLIGL